MLSWAAVNLVPDGLVSCTVNGSLLCSENITHPCQRTGSNAAGYAGLKGQRTYFPVASMCSRTIWNILFPGIIVNIYIRYPICVNAKIYLVRILFLQRPIKNAIYLLARYKLGFVDYHWIYLGSILFSFDNLSVSLCYFRNIFHLPTLPSQHILVEFFFLRKRNSVGSRKVDTKFPNQLRVLDPIPMLLFKVPYRSLCSSIYQVAR